MASNTPSFDFRIANPLVCHPEYGPGQFPRDTLNRCASMLQLFGNLIGSHDGADQVFADEDRRFAFCLQIEGIAATLRAVGDALGESKMEDRR